MYPLRKSFMHFMQQDLAFLMALLAEDLDADLAECIALLNLVSTRQRIVVHFASGRLGEVGTVVIE